MGKSIFTAAIKKIEIINKTANDTFDQSIRIILGDIELNNENLIELRKFRPNEAVKVCLQSQQVSIDELPFQDEIADANQLETEELLEPDAEIVQKEEQDLLFTITEGDEEPDPAEVVKQFDFSLQ